MAEGSDGLTEQLVGGMNRTGYRHPGSCMACFWGTGSPSHWWIERTRATLVHRAMGTYQPSSCQGEAPEATWANCPWGRIRPKKNEAEKWKSLQTTSLCYSVAKYALYVPLTNNKVEKTKTWKFQFCSNFLFFFVMHNLKTIQCVWILCIPNDCSANGDDSYLFWAVYKLRLANYSLKAASQTLCILFQTVL